MATKKATAEVVETPEVEAPKGMRPGALAEELDISPKVLRAWLRRNFQRPSEAKNTSWYLTEDQVEAAREAYTPSDDEDEA